MQRLTRLLTPRTPVPGRRPDDGAVAVIVALLLVVLVGFVGLAVDVSAAYAKTQEAQNGADAGALGVAQACATSEVTCPGGGQTLAHGLATANIRHQLDTVVTQVDHPAANRVRVTVSADRDNSFVRLFGVDSFTVREDATAIWGTPTRGTSALPLVFSMCQFVQQGGTSGAPTTILLTKNSDAPCTLPVSGNTMPAGFGYIGDGQCGAEVAVDGWVSSKNGNNVNMCDSAALQALVGQVVLLPIFDACRASANAPGCTAHPSMSGNDRSYRIHAYAAFELHGFRFGGTNNTTPAPCSGSERCIRGRFVEWVSLDDSFEYGSGPNLGASIVTLVD
jgi:hypothetical protein